MEPKIEVCLFVGYLKGTKGGLFYSLEDRKVFVSANVRFLEDDYVNNFKSKSMVVLEEMSDARSNKSLKLFRNDVVVSDTPQVTTDEIPSTIILHHSGRIIMEPNRFKLLGEAYETISEEPELDPKTYEKEINNMDADCWVKAMETKLEFLYSNQV